MQIDLQEPLILDSAFLVAYIPLRFDKYEPGKIETPKQKITSIRQDGNAYFLDLPVNILTNSTNNLVIYYHGKPVVATKPPWDGGLIWKKTTIIIHGFLLPARGWGECLVSMQRSFK